MLSLISVLVMAIPSSSSTYTTQYTGRGGLNPAMDKGEPNIAKMGHCMNTVNSITMPCTYMWGLLWHWGISCPERF